MNTTSVDAYLRDGCGRCENYQTPACKVHQWTKVLVALREVALASGLTEEMKWGSPTYTLDGKNVLMIVAFKDYCALQFFKGAALEDPDGVLESPGPNSHAVRMLKFRTTAELVGRRRLAKAFSAQAVELERAGTTVAPKTKTEAIPEELTQRLAKDAKLRKAWTALTPGRQRSHVLHIGGAKQAATRERRVEGCAPVILAGKGWNEY